MSRKGDMNGTARSVVITQNGKPRAEQGKRAAIGILKIVARGEQDIRLGRCEDQDALFERLKSKYRS